MIVAEIHRALGIPLEYGQRPFRPQFREAENLVEVGVDSHGRLLRLAPDTAQAWTEMAAAARSDKVHILLVSGYRSIEYQCGLFKKKLAAGLPIDAILAVNAAPGFSQHHTGHAVDVGTPECDLLTEKFERTEAFRWLVSNAHSFHFSMAYPRNNPFGFIYEPWHWAHASIGI
jgi:D-alanyl-D-alanine carboxypeptidase